jgi:hypothetical protein
VADVPWGDAPSLAWFVLAGGDMPPRLTHLLELLKQFVITAGIDILVAMAHIQMVTAI